ncbi:hypothetical protein [Luteolibacter pohnpeiensis]|uniref:hypothetical protein n=1 Tax=Luteolibacter pohnpeiensis TaxID=454153 RepID=UPI001F16ED97|nr:hypothetical protein [Luteolibacter pohnpeiensis]
MQTPPLKPAHYGKEPDPAVIFPVSPQRILAGFVGVGIMLITAMLLMFSTGVGEVLNGVPTATRLVIASFAVLLGVVFLVYANPKARMKGLIVGCLIGAGVMTVPFFFKEGTKQFDPNAEKVAAKPLIPVVDPEVEAFEKLKETIGLAPLVKEQERLDKVGEGKHAYGIWLRNLTEFNKLKVKDFLVQAAHADDSSHCYPRDHDSYLMILTGLDQSIDQIADITKTIGKVKNVYDQIDVIEVEFNDAVFSGGSLDKLIESSDPAFYDLNKRELDSIQMKRVERAVERLADVEPKIYRTDISRKLLELLADPKVQFKGTICRALMVWSEDSDQTAKVVNSTLQDMVKVSQPVPTEMVALLAQLGSVESMPQITMLWFNDPMKWELDYGKFGAAIEDQLLHEFSNTSGLNRASAVRLLAKVGSKKSLPYLEEAKKSASAELSISIDNALSAIRERSS